MVATAPPSQGLGDLSLRQGQVRHALKAALSCTLAAGLSIWFRLPSGQFAPLFAFMLLTLGMPSPRLNWLLTQIAIVMSALVSALILVACGAAPGLYLALTLLWIFTCLLFTNWLSLPANLGAMVSAIGIFVFFTGTVGETLWFYVAYALNWLVGGLVVLVVHTLLWPLNAPTRFLERLAAVYTVLEADCRLLARRVRQGEGEGGAVPEPAPAEATDREWAPFRPLRQALAPELRRGRDTANPFARMILACRALNLRLWFFGRALAPALTAAFPPEARRQLADRLDRCADQLGTLLHCVLLKKQAPVLERPWLEAGSGTEVDRLAAGRDQAQPGGEVLVALGIPQTILHRLMQDLQTVTECHNALLARMRSGLAGELAALSPLRTGVPLLDGTSLRAASKLVLLLLLLLAEEGILGFPGGSQVAFFASTGNLGQQNKTDLFGLAGIVYGVGAAFLSSRLPGFPLLLALVFLGEFLANLAYQKLPRYGVAGLQAGLALCFAYLATPGPEFGSFTAVWVRFAGLAVAGFTAVLVHAYLWPVLPMRRLRALIATALDDTAASLARLFAGPPRATWEGAPPSLDETITRARDLLDDARYLPGAEHADPAYEGVLVCLQEIDANLEYLRFLLSLEPEHALREYFFQVLAAYGEQARPTLEQVARQFQQSPDRPTAQEPVRWQPEALALWQRSSSGSGAGTQGGIDPTRPAVIAHCLDAIASATQRISRIAWEMTRK